MFLGDVHLQRDHLINIGIARQKLGEPSRPLPALEFLLNLVIDLIIGHGPLWTIVLISQLVDVLEASGQASEQASSLSDSHRQ
jgi:hypothetical protein